MRSPMPIPLSLAISRTTTCSRPLWDLRVLVSSGLIAIFRKVCLVQLGRLLLSVDKAIDADVIS